MKNINSLRSALTLIGVTALAGCGGGGSGIESPISVVPAPTPTSSPAPTPTPTPTPTPKLLNTSLPPTRDETFDAASAKLIATVERSTGATSDVSLASRASYATVSVTYDSATRGYTLADEASSKSFVPSSLSTSDRAFDTYLMQGATDSDRLELFRPVPDNDRLALSYLTYGNWSTYQSGSSSTHYLSRFATFGVVTDFATVAKTGTATFSGIADGLTSIDGRAYRLIGSTGTITVDYAARIVRVTINLRGNPDVTSTAPGTVDLGTITSTASFSTTASRFTGTISGIGMDGSIGGGLYGPNAVESGLAFSLKGTSDTSVGVLVAKR